MTLAETIVSASPANFWTATAAGAAVAAFCFYSAFKALHHTRIIEDTPTSKIRSAAQGYTELEGSAELLEGEPIIAPLTGTRCVWYSIEVEERASDSSIFASSRFSSAGDWSDLIDWSGGRKGWSTIRRETSDAIFLLRDDTGACIVDPENAVVNPSSSSTWYGNSSGASFEPRSNPLFGGLFSSHRYRYTEKRIHSGDPLYVIGMFLTMGADHSDPGIQSEVRDLLACWKRDKASLLERFDLNRDGRIDLREWEVARKAARKTVEKSRNTEITQPATNLIRRPVDRLLPFILSAIPQRQLIRRQRRISGLCFIAFLCAISMAAWAVQIRLRTIPGDPEAPGSSKVLKSANPYERRYTSEKDSIPVRFFQRPGTTARAFKEGYYVTAIANFSRQSRSILQAGSTSFPETV